MLSELGRMRPYQTISVSPENMTGAKGNGGTVPLEEGSARNAARELGTGWKTNPYLFMEPGETITLADIHDEGEIRQFWLTQTGVWRSIILRMYWDGDETPAVECPIGDFFCNGLNTYAPVRSLPVCVNPGSGFNCYWPMPFRKGFRFTVENRGTSRELIYYQITYVRKPVEPDALYFHTQFRRENPTEYMKDFTMLEKVEGVGQYVGAYMTWAPHDNTKWWGEGEVKIYLDGDTEHPSVNYTGTEDYFCGSYNYENQKTHEFECFTSPYSGFPQVVFGDHLLHPQTRFGMYRWHITEPMYFTKDVKVTIAMLGWKSGGRYCPLRDDVSCAAFFYLDKTSCHLPELGSDDDFAIDVR